MLDIGLLLTGGVLVAVLVVATRWAPIATMDRSDTLDRLIGPLFAGLLVGRLSAVAIDDPTSLGSVRSLLVIRGGVEFWPGAAGLGLALVWVLRRQRLDVALSVAELVPFVLWGCGTYEFTCFLRDGCFGPSSPIGLVPAGLGTPQFPVGIVVGLLVVLLGVAVRHLWSVSPVRKLLVAVGGVALVRSIAAVWLPRLGTAPTRPHVESVVVLAVTAAAGAALWVRGRTSTNDLAWEGPGPSVDRPRSSTDE